MLLPEYSVLASPRLDNVSLEIHCCSLKHIRPGELRHLFYCRFNGVNGADAAECAACDSCDCGVKEHPEAASACIERCQPVLAGLHVAFNVPITARHGQRLCAC